MTTRKAATKITTAFALLANTVLSPAPAAAQTAAAKAAVLQRTVTICNNMDAGKLLRTSDFIGLLTWEMGCTSSFQATNNPTFLYRAAVAEIALSNYTHTYQRRGPVNPLISELADPIYYVNDARKIMRTLQSRQYDAAGIALVNTEIDRAERYARTPVTPKFDPSKGTACFLDNKFVGDINGRYSADARQKMVDATYVCAQAYNERPVAILANQYAADLYFAAKYVAVTNPSDRSALQAANLAKNFFERAAKDGVAYEDAMALNQNIIDTYSNRDINRNLTLMGLGIFAVAIGFAASGLAFEAAPEVAAATAPGASEAAQQYYFLQWSQRAAAALPGVAP